MRWLLWGVGLLWGQDTLHLTIAQVEARFLQKNLLLLAQKLRIQAEQALVWQARLWPNPQLVVDQMDVFTQAEASFDAGPFLAAPRINQISATLSQTLLTAGKRLKGVALAEASVRLQEAAFAELLRQLRYQLRGALYALQRDQFLLGVLREQVALLDRLRARYKALSQQALVPLPEYLRIENLYLQVQADLRDRYRQWEENQHALRTLLRFSGDTLLWIDTTGFIQAQLNEALRLDSLLLLVEKRGDVRLARETHHYQVAALTLEKAMAFPDVTVDVTYDRLGGYRLNQWAVGFALPLPVFNRNQGRIAAARLLVEQSQLTYEQTRLIAESEVVRAWRQLVALQAQLREMDFALLARYRQAEAAYRENLLAGRISFLAYVDFFQSYRDLAQKIAETFYLLHQAQNEIGYAVGMDR
ncbi:MAG: TolC family protein [Bacteroidia bacterium]|nr:TolC family protein [Bacteroidia bacterium]